jgi:hypothetical protein
MPNPSHIVLTNEKAIELIQKYLAPHEDTFMTFLEQTFPDAGLGCAVMAGCLANQINPEWEQMKELRDMLFNFVVEYVANRDFHENPNSQELN